MTFVKVDVIPKRVCAERHDLRGDLDRFMALQIKTARVGFELGEYICEHSCFSALSFAVRTYGYPIKVTFARGEVYLTRTDM